MNISASDGMEAIDLILEQWLDSLSNSTGSAGASRPAQEAYPMNQIITGRALVPVQTNSAGETWLDAIRACGDRHNNRPEQVEQALSRARALVASGHSTARAVATVCATLRRWSDIRGDDATFAHRREAMARGARFYVVPA